MSNKIIYIKSRETASVTFNNICSTCLSTDRKLSSLSDIYEGVINLFFLLFRDSEAYEELCNKEANIYICWECKALMNRLCKFRDQACIAQKQLYNILRGVKKKMSTTNCLSMLSKFHQDSYNYEYISNDSTLASEEDMESIKSEHYSVINRNTDNEMEGYENDNKYDVEVDDVCIKPYIKSMKNVDSHDILSNDIKVHQIKEIVKENKNYTVIRMTEIEMLDSIEMRRSAKSFVEANLKCNTCIEVHRDDVAQGIHIYEAHEQQPRHIKCDICQAWVKDKWYNEHRSDHYLKFQCHYCDRVFYNILIMLKHLKVGHAVRNIPKEHRALRKLSYSKNPGLKPWLADVSPDEGTSRGFVCSQCQQCFESKKKRLVHITKMHKRPNYECATCGKTFATEFHMKNHKRYECIMCKKGFRTLRDLNDHVNYAHMERTTHKCPVCNKALATTRGVTRHVRRAHLALEVNVGDKILCQICGKAFREKKSLLVHELIHTGEKPLSCDICGRPFRQSAALYMHKRRVHKMALKPQIKHVDDVDVINIKR